MKNVKIAVLTLLIALGAFAGLSTNIQYCEATLNRFSSYAELKEFLRNSRPEYYWNPSNMLLMSPSSRDYSNTNVQVEGVDEADIVKTDGEYIYVISNQKVVIVKAYPAEEAAILSNIVVNGLLRQVFINEERLVLFYENSAESETKTVISIYDVFDKASPAMMREIAVDGTYFSSRMIGDYMYAVIRKGAWLENDAVALPKISSEGVYEEVSATDIYYSSIIDYQYIFTTIVAVNLQNDKQAYKTVLTGRATNMYVSLQNIYLAVSYYGEKTVLHRIHIENGEITYDADGKVPGTVLNQFSMDESEGYFRIATTSQITNPPEGSSWILNLQNNLYVLGMNLEIISKLEGIAPGEKIHSARFMGDICYLVTFRKVDPFFAIDLSNPYDPEILGELKITGYSDYLHLYDESHVIGVGKETVAAEQGDFSWYQGVKISLFDVADMSNPKEIAKYEIGDRGTDAPVLNDHKAFLFDRERNLLVIPVSVAEIDVSKYPNGVPANAYGEIVWQGAYVFTISMELEENLVLKGTISHIENGGVHNASQHITRALYIGEVLYTISNSKIMMNSLSDLSEINEVSLNE